MDFSAVLTCKFSFGHMEQEQRSAYVKEVINNIKRQLQYKYTHQHFDFVEISANMFKADIDAFKEELKVEPIKKIHKCNDKYRVTFRVPTNFFY